MFQFYNKSYTLLISFTFLFISNSQAQSDHYWSQNFNTESALVAGSIVGGDAGPSAVYYNPALINQDESHTFALSASLVSFQSMRLRNLAGNETEYNRLTLQIQPKFLSYTGAPNKKQKIIFEFAFLVPLTKNIQYNYVFENELDIIERLDGNEDYSGQISYLNKYNDYYVGGGFSYKLSDQFTIGASSFLSVKIMDYSSIIAIKAMQDTDTIYSQGIPESYYFAQNAVSENLDYWDLSLIFKFGAHYSSANGKWGLGLNITFPNLNIYGEGVVKKEYYRSNIFDNNLGQFTQDLSFYNFQEKVRTNIKDPFSIAVGIQYKTANKNQAIMLTAEYFADIDEYAMLKTVDSKVIGNLQAENVGEIMNYYTYAKSIFNIGFGFIQYINENLTINGGFKTDFNVIIDIDKKEFNIGDQRPTLTNIKFDKFHIIAGPRLNVKKFGVVLGIQYTWGREQDMLNVVNFSDPIEYNPITKQALQGIRQKNMEIHYNEISLFFGLSYVFGK